MCEEGCPRMIELEQRVADLEKRIRSTGKQKHRDGTEQYAEYVWLKLSEYAILCERYGIVGADRIIEILDDYKGSTGKQYVDDYRAIRSWVITRYEQEQHKPRPPGSPINTVNTDDYADWR